MSRLTKQEIMKVVNRYIGVSGGYLGSFSYRTHAEFYPEYCGLEIDPGRFEGTTRERFIAILESRAPADQAKILRGVIDLYPPGQDPGRQGLAQEINGWVRRLEGASPISNPNLTVTIDIVPRALGDAEALIQSSGASSAVDRVHTALHGYLIALCRQAGIVCEPDASMTALFKSLRELHPRLQPAGPRAEDLGKVMRGLASILDALNPVRNKASVAHPNEAVLESAEAMLVVNTARTLLHYLSDRLERSPARASTSSEVGDLDVPF